jgi:hypothetical protein
MRLTRYSASLLEHWATRLAKLRTAGLSIALLAAACGPPRPSSDASIIARFTAPRDEFSQLLVMFREDEIVGR